MSFPIIGGKHVWEEWGDYGSSGQWHMWFMAPYGAWMYAGFIKNYTIQFKKIDIGGSQDYPIIDWDLGDTTTGPDTAFPYESPGVTNRAHRMGMGCIRTEALGANPRLFLIGRSTGGAVLSCILRRFNLDDGFDEDGSGKVLMDESGATPLPVSRIVGLEVIPGVGIFVLTNNDLGAFKLFKYAEDGVYTGGNVVATQILTLSPAYIESNTLARLRGIASATDGNILIFANTGNNAGETKVNKFRASDLGFIGNASWSPSISAVTWAYVVRSGEVFLYFEGLTSSGTAHINSVYYDRGTGIPTAENSNFIIEDNLTSFGDDTAVLLKYQARDAFNVPVINTPTKFVIGGVLENDPNTWTDRTGAIRDTDVGDFFVTDSNDPDYNDPLSVSAVVDTDGLGVALAYYKPMRTGTGTKIETINVICPASI